jgi:hypothetical protein
MPADNNDHNQLPAVCTTQVTPNLYNTGGVLCSSVTNGSAYMATPVAAAQVTTQSNLGVGLGQNQQSFGIQNEAVPAMLNTASLSPGVMGTGNLATVVAQVPPNQTPGILNTPSIVTVTAQLTTQVNPISGYGALAGLSNVQAEQQLAVTGPVYKSPGGILNEVALTGTVTTGGGP